MICDKVTACLAFVCVIGGSLALPAAEIKNALDGANLDKEASVPAGLDKDTAGLDLGKRFGSFDSINHFSDFGKFQKRKNGESKDLAENLADKLKRAGFDSIHHFSDFGRFNKRSVDRAYFARSYADKPWKRRGFDSIHHFSDFGRFNRRK